MVKMPKRGWAIVALSRQHPLPKGGRPTVLESS